MPIPSLNADGFLPEGIHDCTLDELEARFGQFQDSDRRCRLFEKFREYVREARSSGVVKSLFVDGSFATGKPNPSDIDLIVISLARELLPATLRPAEYNALSKRHIRRKFGMDVLLAQDGEMEVDEHVEFFSQVRNRPEVRKGLLRITL
ncbi:MAG: nucleotidyltransferase domain-containing protein [Pirellulaceae bacterium]|nr:nucleotidyltransferase domain-containing protein [Pirellulaceae bacterium]